MSAYTPAFDPSLSVVELDPQGGMIAQAFERYRVTSDLARPAGVHLSNVLRDMLKTLYPKKYSREFDRRSLLAYQETGNIVETVIASILQSTYAGWEKPAPRRCDGLWCSPDGYQPRTKAIDEIKVTWASEREFLDSVKFLSYVWQSLSYAHVWDAQRIRLHVLFINGHYPRGAPIPNTRTFHIRWKGDAPGEKFRMIRQHAFDIGMLHGQEITRSTAADRPLGERARRTR